MDLGISLRRFLRKVFKRLARFSFLFVVKSRRRQKFKKEFCFKTETQNPDSTGLLCGFQTQDINSYLNLQPASTHR